MDDPCKGAVGTAAVLTTILVFVAFIAYSGCAAVTGICLIAGVGLNASLGAGLLSHGAFIMYSIWRFSGPLQEWLKAVRDEVQSRMK